MGGRAVDRAETARLATASLGGASGAGRGSCDDDDGAPFDLCRCQPGTATASPE